MIISHRLHHHPQYISCDNWTKRLTWFCPTCSVPVHWKDKNEIRQFMIQIWYLKNRCYIGKFPFVLIIQKKPELLQKTYFRSIFLLFSLLHSVGRVDTVIHVFLNILWRYICRYSCRLCTDMLHYFMPFFVIGRVGNCIIPSAAYHISCKITVKQLVKS